MTAVPTTLLDRLALVGEALHGADWQRAMARDLGPYAPGRPRPRIDDRLLRRWVAGERPVPAWVGDALPRLLAAGVVHRRDEIRQLEALARSLGYPAPADVALATVIGDSYG